jgi:hypothetical protein
MTDAPAWAGWPSGRSIEALRHLAERAEGDLLQEQGRLGAIEMNGAFDAHGGHGEGARLVQRRVLVERLTAAHRSDVLCHQRLAVGQRLRSGQGGNQTGSGQRDQRAANVHCGPRDRPGRPKVADRRGEIWRT